MKRILVTLAIVTLFAGSAHALPALQLGPGAGNWTYDNGTQTWVTQDNPLELCAFANATMADGGNGDFAWDPAGNPPRRAFLVVSAVPKVNMDVFDVTVTGDGGNLTMVSSGVGSPPVSDPNDLAPHGIFDTWFEIYEFTFSGPTELIGDQQPGETGTGQGYKETFSISYALNDINAVGVHFDLFTIQGDGKLDDPTDQVKSFAPFSHDAEGVIPEPTTLTLLGLGLVGAGVARRRRK